MITVDGASPDAVGHTRATVPRDAPPTRRHRVAVGLWLWSLTLAVATASRHLAGSFLDREIVNADTLGPPAVFDAVRMDGIDALTEWYWPAAPYFLLDFVLYLPIWLAVPDPWFAPAVFLVLQLLLLQYAIVGVCRLVEPRRVALSSFVGFTLLVVLAHLAIRPASYLLASSFHTSAFIATLLLVRWFVVSGGRIGGRPDPRSRRHLAGIATVVALLVLSDPLFLVSTVAPLVVVGVAARLAPPGRPDGQPNWRGSPPVIGAMLVGAAIGMMLNAALRSTDTPYGPQLAGSDPFGRLRQLASVVLAIDPPLAALIVASIGLGLAVLVPSGSGDRQRFALVAAFWVVGLGSHGAALVFTDGSLALRYLLVALLLPIVLIGPAVVRAEGLVAGVAPVVSWLVPAVTGLGVGVLAVTVIVVPASSDLASVRSTSRPELVRCVDDFVGPDRDGTIGLADYWSARRLQLFGSSDTRVVGMDWHGRPLRINTSSRWLGQPYDYLVIEDNPSGWSPPTDQFHASGLVEAATTCGAFEMIRFAEPGLTLPLLDGPRDAVTFDGCLLGSQSGRVDPERCEVRVEGADTATFGSFGGYLLVGAGRYEATIEYSSSQRTSEEAALVEITRQARGPGDVHVVATGTLPGTGGLTTSVTVDFEVSADRAADGALVEARTVVRGDYTIGSVTFRRLAGDRVDPDDRGDG